MERWQRALDALNEGYALLDGSGRIERCDEALGRLLGLSSGELTGRALSELFEDFPKGEVSSARSPTGHRPEHLKLVRNGRRFEVRLTPVPHWAGAATAAVCVITDLTDASGSEPPEARKPRPFRGHFRPMSFLSRSAAELIDQVRDEDIFWFVARHVSALAGDDAFVVVNEFDPALNQVIVRAISGEPARLAALPRILGRNPVGLTYTFAESYRTRLKRGCLVRVRGGIHELTFGQMPRDVARGVEELLKVGRVYAVSFALRGDFLGMVAILVPPSTRPSNPRLIEAFVRQAAVALQRRRVRQALCLTEEWFRSMIETASEGVWVVDTDRRTTYVNSRMAELLGYTVEEMLGRGWFDFVDEAEFRESSRGLPPLGPSGKATRELRLRKRDGSHIWALVSDTLLTGPDGKPTGILKMVADITQRKAIEERLHESEERLRLALEAAEMGTWRLDLRTNLETRDGGFNRILGLEPVVTIQPVLDFLQRVHPEDRACLGEALRKPARSQGIFETEYRVVCPDGAVRWVRDRGKAIFSETGEPVYLTGVAVDITDLKRAEKECELLQAEIAGHRRGARLQAAQLGAILENLREAVIVIDAAGNVILRNPMAREISGGADGDIADIPACSSDGDESSTSRLRLLWLDGTPVAPDQLPVAVLLRGEDLTNREFLIKRPDGTTRRVLCSGTAVRDENGKILFCVMTCRDVTELRRLENAKDEFLQVLAHELRNPLAAAFGLVQLVQRQLCPPGAARLADHLRLAETELKRLDNLISEIITGYRVSGGRLPLEFRPVDLAAVLREAVQPVAADPSRRVIFEAPEDPIPVNADHRRLVEVLRNLLSNAVKYSPAGGRIWVSSTTREGSVLVVVEDEGIGIPPEQLERVFEGFFRATNLTGRQPGGLGLGLYISRDIARRHGGDLWAENRPGGGTRMCLKLPLAPGGEGAAGRG